MPYTNNMLNVFELLILILLLCLHVFPILS